MLYNYITMRGAKQHEKYHFVNNQIFKVLLVHVHRLYVCNNFFKNFNDPNTASGCLRLDICIQ